MRRARKFISAAAMLSIALAPVLGSGCVQSTPSTTEQSTTAKHAETSKSGPPKKTAKKPPTDSAESGSDRGAGVKPPVK